MGHAWEYHLGEKDLKNIKRVFSSFHRMPITGSKYCSASIILQDTPKTKDSAFCESKRMQYAMISSSQPKRMQPYGKSCKTAQTTDCFKSLLKPENGTIQTQNQ